MFGVPFFSFLENGVHTFIHLIPKRTFTHLIPKKATTNRVREYRPTSLVNNA